MRKKLALLAAAFIVATLFIGLSTTNVSAATPDFPNPTVFVNWVNTWDHQPKKAAGAVGTTQRAYIKTFGLPHETHEPALATDKTWLAEVKVKWDPAVLQLTTWIEPPYWNPAVPTTAGSLFKFNVYDPEFPEDPPLRQYNTVWTVTYDAGTDPGSCIITYALLEDVTTIPVPVDWGACPDAAVHDGSFYDLPYTVGPQGTATNGKYVNMAELRWKVLVDTGNWSVIDLYDPVFVSYGKVVYNVDAVDGIYGEPPVPEFPLGIGVLMTIALIIPTAYIWRLRKRNR